MSNARTKPEQPERAPKAKRPPKPELAEQAAKISAMLDRWARQDISDEPEWDIEDMEPVRFHEIVVEPDDERGSSPIAAAPRPPKPSRSAGR